MLLRCALFIAVFFAAALAPKNSADAGSKVERTFGQLVLAEKLGIDHPDQVIDVYYFHALPKSFSGAVLRLHSLAASGQQGTFADIAPERDTLVFFRLFFHMRCCLRNVRADSF